MDNHSLRACYFLLTFKWNMILIKFSSAPALVDRVGIFNLARDPRIVRYCKGVKFN